MSQYTKNVVVSAFRALYCCNFSRTNSIKCGNILKSILPKITEKDQNIIILRVLKFKQI